MGHTQWEVVWERVRSGKHTVVISSQGLAAVPHDLTLVHVRCEASWRHGEALERVLRQVEHLLGETLLPSTPPPTGSLQRLFGDMPEAGMDAVLVEACNRLLLQTQGRAALAFEHVEAADEITVETLRQILQRPGWLRLPLVLVAQSAPGGLVAEVLYLLCHDDDPGTVMEIADTAAEAPEADVQGFAWTSLPADVLRVLRAATVIGASFEAALVAALLDEPLGLVLEKLQWAADAGAPLADRGHGYFAIPEPAITALQSRLLPSLLTFWHARLGEILGRPQEVPPAFAETQPEALVQDDARVSHAPAHPQHPPETSDGRAPAPYADLFEPVSSDQAPAGSAAAIHDPSADALSATGDMPTQPPARPLAGHPFEAPHTAPAGPSRAAAHLQAAGQTEAAVEQYLTAVRESTARGETRRAYGMIDQALVLLDRLPASSRRAVLCVQLLLERALLQWHGALQGAAFTLQEALTTLDAVQAALPAEAPPEVLAQVATVVAGVCYDLGTLEALQRALVLLTESSRHLLQSGQALLATRLLNEQAAVYIRLGDAVRANHLLAKSREVFEARVRENPQDLVALAELAETNHLFARLPLHVAARPGREADAAAMGVAYARAAEQAYQQLRQPQPLTRVWETLGRLEMQRGQLQEAQAYLSKAFELQRQLGDVIGLARSAAALGELYGRAGQLQEAAGLLIDSVTLNLEKGSPIGLAFNRQALDRLSRLATPRHGSDSENIRRAMTEVERRLTQAEAVLGQVTLPPSATLASSAED